MRRGPAAGVAAGGTAAIATVVLLGTGAGAPAATPSALKGRIDAYRARQAPLSASVAAADGRIEGFQGRIDSTSTRLHALQASLDTERSQFASLGTRLLEAHSNLAGLQARLGADRQVLAQELRADYENDRPDIVSVVIESNGFADLLERVDAMKRIAQQNLKVIARVRSTQTAVAAQTARLTFLHTRQQQVTNAVLVQRDELAQVRLALVRRQSVFARRRDRSGLRLDGLRARRRGLERQLAAIQARETAAQGGLGGARSGGAVGPFAPHGGNAGFFPAPGTDYSVGDEPQIAARLDALGKAQGLHLVGISGYRSPSHSAAVGGFPNDPHTRGQASDTPGVEGVSEVTLERFGLERPFAGAAEADHIQLLDSPL